MTDTADGYMLLGLIITTVFTMGMFFVGDTAGVLAGMSLVVLMTIVGSFIMRT